MVRLTTLVRRSALEEVYAYHEQTEAVVAKYAERGILTQVDGIGAIDEVTDRVMQAIKEAQAA